MQLFLTRADRSMSFMSHVHAVASLSRLHEFGQNDSANVETTGGKMLPTGPYASRSTALRYSAVDTTSQSCLTCCVIFITAPLWNRRQDTSQAFFLQPVAVLQPFFWRRWPVNDGCGAGPARQRFLTTYLTKMNSKNL